MKNYIAYIKRFALSIKKLKHEKVLLLLLTLIVSIQPAKVFALKESEWDIFDINGIYYYDRDAENCVTSNLSGTIGKLYDGSEIISKSDLDKINANRPVYEKSAARYGFPWQLIATLHYRETSLRRYNPTNGQGIYQLYSYTGGGHNSNAFTNFGEVSEAEFQRQTDIMAELLQNNYGAGLNLKTDDGIKTLLFRYNGTARSYISQARTLGYTEQEAARGEGSPYVMNLADSKRDSRKNSNWLMIKTDHGHPTSANLIPGAFLIFSALGGSNGISNCSGSGGGNLSINQTALNLAWANTGHGITPNDNYRNALIETGINRLGDRWSMMGASCDAFVATVIRYSGIDKNFVCCGVSNGGPTSNYVKNSGKFVEVENRQGSLKPGDIRLSSGHIEIYVEQNGVGKIASASHGSRTGELLPFYDNSRTFKAYRYIGSTNI